MTTNIQNTTDEKLQMHNVTYYIGKVIDPNKWEIPSGYQLCRMTGELYPEADLEITFRHTWFDRELLIAKNIYIEDAEWLSARGFIRIMDVLAKMDCAGYEHAYAAYVEQDKAALATIKVNNTR